MGLIIVVGLLYPSHQLLIQNLSIWVDVRGAVAAFHSRLVELLVRAGVVIIGANSAGWRFCTSTPPTVQIQVQCTSTSTRSIIIVQYTVL